MGLCLRHCALIKMASKVKGKVYPRTGRECPKAEYRNSSSLSLTSAVDGVTPRMAALLPGKRYGNHCVEGCVDSRAGLDGFTLFSTSPVPDDGTLKCTETRRTKCNFAHTHMCVCVCVYIYIYI